MKIILQQIITSYSSIISVNLVSSFWYFLFRVFGRIFPADTFAILSSFSETTFCMNDKKFGTDPRKMTAGSLKRIENKNIK